MTSERRPFAHEALLAMAPEADDRAPGGAITVALCGAWTHEPPCPLAPHHTAAERSGTDVRLRILFAAEPATEAHVRKLIDGALRQGEAQRPDGGRVEWRLLNAGPSEVRPTEAAHAQRLIRS